jgi:hypothetical protein
VKVLKKERRGFWLFLWFVRLGRSRGEFRFSGNKWEEEVSFNTRTPEHPNTRTPEHPNTRTPEHPNTLFCAFKKDNKARGKE